MRGQKKICGGYILVSTIWVLAFLSIAAASIGQWYEKSLALAGERVSGSQARVTELSTRATLLYKIATADIGKSGIFLSSGAEPEEETGARNRVRDGRPDIIFDGMAYKGYGDTLFAIQDESGLWGLIPHASARTRGLLVSRGVDFQEADILASRLADYVDEDDLVRINGAEAVDYRFAGLEPPPNRRLESVYELKGVMGWSELDFLWRDNSLPGLISMAWGGKPNPGTAPREILLGMPGATPELVDGLIAQRHGDEEPNEAVTSWVRELAAMDVFSNMARPSYDYRFRFWRDGEGQRREYSIQFTPGNRAPTPWVIENNYRQPLSRDQLSESAKTAQLPDFVL